MNDSPAFQFYAQDFLTGVMYLTNEEKGIYITMLAKQWTDGKIPKKRLGFLVGLEWDQFSEELKAKFKDLGQHLVNERLEKERAKRLNFLKKQIENGSKGGRPRKSTPKINPNKTQKKPLEDRRLKTENENEGENENEYKGGYGGKPNPTVEEMRNYLSQYEIELTDKDAEEFLNYYQARDWIVKGTPIVKWQPALKKWMNNEFRNIKIPKGNRLNGRKNRAPEPEPGQDFGEL